MKYTFINISGENEKIGDSDIDIYNDIFLNRKMNIFIFKKGFIGTEILQNNIILSGFSDETNLINKVLKIRKENTLYLINSFLEDFNTLVNKLRSLLLGKKINNSFFIDKSIQRLFLKKYCYTNTIRYNKILIKDIDINELEKEYSYPFILKPIVGSESKGVIKIHNKNEFNNLYCNTNERNYLIEKFIEGDLYSVDIFITNIYDIIFGKSIKSIVAQDIKIDDLFILSHIIKGGNSINLDSLKVNLSNLLRGIGVSNSFLRLEFKVCNNGDIKIIELNNRIGAFSFFMYKYGLGFNLLELPYGIENLNIKLVYSNTCFITIYPINDGLFNSYNDILFLKIKNLKSFMSMKLKGINKFQKIGLSKNGYSKLGTIKLTNKDEKQFNSDYYFIISNYRNLIIYDKKNLCIKK